MRERERERLGRTCVFSKIFVLWSGSEDSIHERSGLSIRRASLLFSLSLISPPHTHAPGDKKEKMAKLRIIITVASFVYVLLHGDVVVKKIDFDIDNTERSSIVYDPIWKQFELRNVESCCVGD